MNVAGSVLLRLAAGAVVVLGTSAVLFFALTVLPGDPAARVLGMGATKEQVRLLRTELGLDRPAAQRYGEWLTGLAQGDLGVSLVSRTPVADLVAPRLVNTLVLAAAAAVVVVVLALATGVVAGLTVGSAGDRGLTTLAMGWISIPDFVLAGLLLAVVGFGLGWLPPTSILSGTDRPWDDPATLVLPALSLAVPAAAWVFRYVRAGVASAAGSAHVEAARLAGLPAVRVVARHLLPAALAPALPAFGYAGAFLLGGTVVVERVFSYPGMGLVMIDAVAGRDAPVVLAIGVLLSAAVVAGLTLADVAAAVLDPRTRRRVVS